MAIPPRAQKDLRSDTLKKMRLEKALARTIKRWGGSVADEITQTLAMDGSISAELENNLKEILNAHYLDTVEVFAKFNAKEYFSDGIVDVSNERQSDTILIIVGALLALILLVSPDRLRKILTTTSKNIVQSVQNARDLIKPGVEITRQKLAVMVAKIFKNRINNRAPNIAITETNWVAESTRGISTQKASEQINLELQKLNENINANKLDDAKRNLRDSKAIGRLSYSTRTVPKVLDSAEEDLKQRKKRIKPRIIRVFKIWLTMQDKRVRPTHKAALGQRVRENEPFSVGTSKLMYPGDTTLGASLNEIARCRCWVLYD